MKRWTRSRLLVGVVVVAVVGLLGLRVFAGIHVPHVTGQAEPPSLNCLDCHGPQPSMDYRTRTAHPDPRILTASADGKTLYGTCGPVNSVAVIDVAARKLRRLVMVPGRPRGLTLSPDGATLAVALEEADAVALLDTTTFEERARIGVGAGPSGVAFGADGRLLFVCNRLSGDASIVDMEAGRELRRVAAGREPYAATASPDGARVAILSRMAEIDRPERVPRSEVTILDGRDGRVERRVWLESCHMSEDITFTPDGSRLLIPTMRVRNLLPIVQVARSWVMSSILAVIDPVDGATAYLPLNDQNTCLADPSGVAVSADGQDVWVAGGGTDEVLHIELPALLALEDQARVDDPERLGFTHRYARSRHSVGDNPRDTLWLESEGLLAVAERLDDTIALLDRSGELVARIAMGRTAEDDLARRGERVFHDATYAFQRAFSCRSCHPDAHTDGLTYDFDIDGVGRDIVLNRSLQGVKGTAPFKWIGLNPSLKRQCGARFAMVLTRADVFPEEKLDDLVGYLQSLQPPRPDPLAGVVSKQARGALERGRTLFERTTRKDGTIIPPSGRCVTCHPPPHYSNFLRADVGSQSPTDKTGNFDVPHLTGIGSKAPYLHDGRARSLEEIWTAPGVGDLHGVMTDLGKTELNDLIEFLKSL